MPEKFNLVFNLTAFGARRVGKYYRSIMITSHFGVEGLIDGRRGVERQNVRYFICIKKKKCFPAKAVAKGEVKVDPRRNLFSK